MASDSSPSGSGLKPPSDLPLMVSGAMEPAVLAVIESLKQQLTIDRSDFVKKRIEENRKKMTSVTNYLFELSQNRRQAPLFVNNVDSDLLSKRQKDAIDMQNGAFDCADDGGCSALVDEPTPSVVLLGSGITVRSSVCPIKLPEVKRLPPYTTWIFLDKNQRMTEDQSIVGRRRIYYDQNGGEALICSDSEEEAVEDEDDKREFVEAEQIILRNTIDEVGLSDAVLDSLAKCLFRKPSDIKARYEFLVKQNDIKDDIGPLSHFLEKDFDAALDSFDNLFCRRCLVFDCKLHGCSQDLVVPHEKQNPWSPPDDDSNPCGPHCYRLDKKKECVAMGSLLHDHCNEKRALSADDTGGQKHKKKAGSSHNGKNFQNEGVSLFEKNITRSGDSVSKTGHDTNSAHSQFSPSESVALEKVENHNENSKRFPELVSHGSQKRQKKLATSSSDSIGSQGTRSRGVKLRSDVRKENENAVSPSHERELPGAGGLQRKDSVVLETDELCLGNSPDIASSKSIKHLSKMTNQETSLGEECAAENVSKKEASYSECWRTIETDLFDKGVEIFGRNSCLIARNTLSGMKTCSEIYQYMRRSGNDLSLHTGDGAITIAEGYPKTDGNTVRRRSKFLRRRGKVRRLKYTGKSAAYQSYRKRISESKNMPCRQYNPCGCQTSCGKDCACLANGTCCEKYCGLVSFGSVVMLLYVLKPLEILPVEY
uniref:Histone-lysine N-methyltransferase CLF-like HTH domain-containing protein n=1 Tax=Kalanchoe fedtschenkoi TaxID=63787 RepID=A0A7N0ZT56_KALFE